VIGAGIAGLACARTLQDHGLEVAVFDKGRRPGGRLATRETRGVPERWFDHGAQYFTARDPRFTTYVRSWAEDGLVEPWTGRVVDIDAEGRRAFETGDSMGGPEGERGPQGMAGRPAGLEAARWVSTGRGINAVAAHLAADVEVACGVRITTVRRASSASAPARDAWHLTDVDGQDYGPFDAVVITAPAPQAADLLADANAPELAAAASGAELDPCWTLMVEFAEPLDVDFEGARFAIGPIAWMKRQGAAGVPPERWVLQAGADWSDEHLEDAPEQVTQALLGALEAQLGEWGATTPEVVHSAAHRWRYARARLGPGADAEGHRIIRGPGGLVLAGDWIAGSAGARVEGAWLSGIAAAGHVLAFAPDGAETRGGSPNRPTPRSGDAGGGESAVEDAQGELFR
jgi:predicted NAD/FAD-dependent oxidoreductase